MIRVSTTVIALAAMASTLALAADASAQVRYRRPYAETYRLNYGFDSDGGASGCDDYTCGGACYNGHRGSDFGTPTGTRVLAGAAGRVISRNDGCANTGFLGSTCGGGCGNSVLLQHSDGSRTLYCHMQNGSVAVSTGQNVTCGQALGRTASSGNSTGPHLHFGFRPSATGAYQDPFRGTCGGPVTRWIGQAGYREAPSTSCGCVPAAETCNGRDDDCDGRIDDGVSRACSTACGSGTQACASGAWAACSARAPTSETCNSRDDDCDSRTDEGDLCEIDLLHDQPSAYAPPRSTDVNADGRADLCARGYGGVRCWTASATGWGAPWSAVPWSDTSGWSDVDNYATLRMGDVDGDGRADLCARANASFLCALSTGTAFATHTTWRDGISDANGWDQPKLYTTLRLADVNGDGKDDLCARDSEGFGCWLSNGTAFDRRIEGPRWSDASGWGVAKHYGTIRMGDLNGDRRADVCARAAAGVECWLSSGDGFPTRIAGPEWSDASGWGAMSAWSTLRLVDFDGDGLGDLCGRSSADLACVRGTGTAFEAPVVVAALSDESGWGDRSNYATLRVGDVDGDGADDLCLRSNTEVLCYAWDGAAFARRSGPAWSDASSWDEARYYQTLRLADFDGDGLDDVCARAGAGWRCHPSMGDGFGDAITLDDLTDDGGWIEHRYWSTILSAGHACRAEMESCNGRDDDCDGMVDEHAVEEICNAADDDCDGETDEHAIAETCNELDDDCDGALDEGLICERPDAGRRGDGGATGGRDGGTSSGGELAGGCACRAGGRGSAPSGALVVLAVLLGISRRRLRRAR